MKAVVIEQYGDKHQLKEKELDQPVPDENQVVVELHATSINPIDWKLREGYLKEMLDFDFPIILGWDAAGVIKEVGTAVEKFKVGDRVFARPETTRFGTYAEYTTVDEHLLAYLPENVSFEEAAAVPLAGLTAWQCLVDFAEIQEGDRVLVHAGSGGVGHYAIQIAKQKGAYVATTASGKNKEWVENLGVDRFINYKEEDFTEVLSDYDIVLDTLGGEIQEKSFKVLKEGGRLPSIVQPPEESLTEKYGVKADFIWLEPSGEKLSKLATMMQEGDLVSVVGHRFDLTEEGLKEAHALSESHHAKGKIIIKIK
ncbi:NADP-dependent oxidoreductase [Halobacillus karajensis]|uniref:Zinc-type alcohol dehydrogenase-like protein n=1 Tax=Halobacillus karajensis TaxID=195088 RepID=A0A024P5E7_9BACI|nr:NADP-dependent oxidoreductase [Halobacillus karajensis]CDQ18731.1 Zinc-type alcohol dehydrogenase-like protein [Halobacillus karajensis]CDQ23197.1 Zinc-type alcohol dehydrogenase-like protein [Halobacillus karajensis]CDQ26679.1 Zinc-type alcohol dehydrogenase-like protein [Halobacillus karajensis]